MEVGLLCDVHNMNFQESLSWALYVSILMTQLHKCFQKSFKSSLFCFLVDFNSARELESSGPVDTMLFLMKDNTLVSYTDQRDSKGVSMQ